MFWRNSATAAPPRAGSWSVRGQRWKLIPWRSVGRGRWPQRDRLSDSGWSPSPCEWLEVELLVVFLSNGGLCPSWQTSTNLALSGRQRPRCHPSDDAWPEGRPAPPPPCWQSCGKNELGPENLLVWSRCGRALWPSKIIGSLLDQSLSLWQEMAFLSLRCQHSTHTLLKFSGQCQPCCFLATLGDS